MRTRSRTVTTGRRARGTSTRATGVASTPPRGRARRETECQFGERAFVRGGSARTTSPSRARRDGRFGAEAYDHLAGVVPREQPEERRDGALQALHHRFLILDAPGFEPAADLGHELGVALHVVRDDETLHEDAIAHHVADVRRAGRGHLE